MDVDDIIIIIFTRIIYKFNSRGDIQRPHNAFLMWLFICAISIATLRVFDFSIVFSHCHRIISSSVIDFVSFSLTRPSAGWRRPINFANVKFVWNGEIENRSEYLNVWRNIRRRSLIQFTQFRSPSRIPLREICMKLEFSVMMTGVARHVCIFHCTIHWTKMLHVHLFECYEHEWKIEWKTGGSFRHAQHISPLQKYFFTQRRLSFQPFYIAFLFFFLSCFSAQKWFAGIFMWMSHASAVEFIR